MSLLTNNFPILRFSLLLFLLTLSLWLIGCKSNTPPNANAQGTGGGAGGRGGGRGGGGAGGEALPPRNVRLVQATDRTLTQIVTATGTLAADEQASLSFRVAGRL